MTYLALFLAVVIVALLVAAVGVIFALLKRLDQANRAVLDQAQAVMSMAAERDKASPKLIERMLSQLADSTTQIHATINDSIKTVLVPPPMQIIDAPGTPFPMPTMNEGKESAPWDHTDIIFPDPELQGPHAVMGYEHETSPDFDPENPFGIPGMKSMVP